MGNERPILRLASLAVDCRGVNISVYTIPLWKLLNNKSVRLRYFVIMLLLYCCDPHYDLCFSIPSLPFLKLHGVCCHFSFMNNPSERRSCVIPNSEALLAKLDGVKSPCIINVKTSVVFKFDLIPDEFADENTQHMLLIWDFDVDHILTANTVAVAAVVPDFDNILETPLLAVDAVSCNCSNFPDTDEVLLPPLNETTGREQTHETTERNEDNVNSGRSMNNLDEDSKESDRAEESDDELSESDDKLSESDEGESDEEDEITHAVPFKHIGAAHDKNYQHHLEQAYLALHEQDKPVDVKIRPEPQNPMDPSAIAIDIDYGTGWAAHVGYIASELCKYLHPLIAAGDILDIFVQHIRYRVDFLKIGFYPKIVIKRRGEWENIIVRKSLSVR